MFLTLIPALANYNCLRIGIAMHYPDRHQHIFLQLLVEGEPFLSTVPFLTKMIRNREFAVPDL